jgi:muramoyltetrapeptide carboxypeptidase
VVLNGFTIGIISPSSPSQDPLLSKKASTFLRSQGVKVKFGSSTRLRRGFLAGSDSQRAEDLQLMLKDPTIDGILAKRGGYGSTRLFPHLDQTRYSFTAKPLIGYSDVTSLLTFCYSRGIAYSIHGPTFESLGRQESHPSNWLLLSRILSRTLTSYSLRESYGYRKEACRIIACGSAEGPLIGGNLTVLCSLLGTPWFPSLKGKIFFIEDIGEAPYRLDRMFFQLSQAGALAKLRGIALGSFERCQSYGRDSVFSVCKEHLSELGIPVVFGLPFGHGSDNGSLPLGARAYLDTVERDLVIQIHSP